MDRLTGLTDRVGCTDVGWLECWRVGCCWYCRGLPASPPPAHFTPTHRAACRITNTLPNQSARNWTTEAPARPTAPPSGGAWKPGPGAERWYWARDGARARVGRGLQSRLGLVGVARCGVGSRERRGGAGKEELGGALQYPPFPTSPLFPASFVCPLGLRLLSSRSEWLLSGARAALRTCPVN